MIARTTGRNQRVYQSYETTNERPNERRVFVRVCVCVLSSCIVMQRFQLRRVDDSYASRIVFNSSFCADRSALSLAHQLEVSFLVDDDVVLAVVASYGAFSSTFVRPDYAH